jgi:hypothetical protein
MAQIKKTTKRRPAKPAEPLETLVDRNSRGPIILVTVLNIILAGLAFVLSYPALMALAQASNIYFPDLWPLIIDGFIVLATVAAWVLRDRRGVVWYPWAALGLFAASSIAGNSYHAILSESVLKVPVIVASLVSSAPAIALLIASHLLVIMVSNPKPKKTNKLGYSNDEILALAHKIEYEQVGSVPIVGVEPLTLADKRMKEIGSQAKIPSNQDEDLLSWVRNRIASQMSLTGADIAEYLGDDVSVRTGQRKLRTLKEQYPEIQEYATRDLQS